MTIDVNMSLDDLISSKKSKKGGGKGTKKDGPKTPAKKTTSRESAVTMSLDDMIKSDRTDRGTKRSKGGKGKDRTTPGARKGSKSKGKSKGKGRRIEWDDDWDEKPRTSKGKGKGKGSKGRGKGRGKGGKGKGGVSGGYRLKLSNLDFSIMVDDIEELFGDINGLNQVWIDYDTTDRSIGKGGAVFSSEGGLRKALEYNGQAIEGQNLRLTREDVYPTNGTSQVKTFSTTDDDHW